MFKLSYNYIFSNIHFNKLFVLFLQHKNVTVPYFLFTVGLVLSFNLFLTVLV